MKRNLKMVALFVVLVFATGMAVSLIVRAQPTPNDGSGRYRSPFDLSYSPDGKWIAVSDRTAGALSIIDVAAGQAVRQVALDGEATGVVWSPSGQSVFVAEYRSGTACEINPATGAIVRRLPAGPRPMGLAVAPNRGLLLSANYATHTVTVSDIASGK